MVKIIFKILDRIIYIILEWTNGVYYFSKGGFLN